MASRGFNNTPLINKRPKESKHLIDDISYSKDFIVCTCAWKGKVNDFQPHRKEVDPSFGK